MLCALSMIYFFCVLSMLHNYEVHAGAQQYDPYDPLSPNIDPAIGFRGMMIDAGSGGSRLHIFSWEPRIFDVVPPPLSFPNSDEKTTARISPGISDYVDDLPKLKEYLKYLIDDCKVTLQDYASDWHMYPFYLRATGGMRLVPRVKREAMMTFIRDLLSDKDFCPFYFQFSFARVLSGEEEAAFAWTGSNYLFNTLFPSLRDRNTEAHETYGTVDMGGASTQISFFVPQQDISEGLFKLQVGSQRHWNLYAKSFLEYGHNSARRRHLEVAARSALNSGRDQAEDPCFFSGYEEEVTTPTVLLNGSSAMARVSVAGPRLAYPDQFNVCMESLKPLLQKQLNSFCMEVYDGECSMDGFYQPQLPSGRNGHFIASAMYKYPWYFLQMPETSTIRHFKSRAEDICALSYRDVLKYNDNLGTSVKKDDNVKYYCFLSSYISVLLEHGYGFSENQTFTVVDSVGGHKLGWALGSMLFEINGLPFIIRPLTWHYYFFNAFSFTTIGFIVGAAGCWLHLHHSLPCDKRRAYEPIPDSSFSL